MDLEENMQKALEEIERGRIKKAKKLIHKIETTEPFSQEEYELKKEVLPQLYERIADLRIAQKPKTYRRKCGYLALLSITTAALLGFYGWKLNNNDDGIKIRNHQNIPKIEEEFKYKNPDLDQELDKLLKEYEEMLKELEEYEEKKQFEMDETGFKYKWLKC